METDSISSNNTGNHDELSENQPRKTDFGELKSEMMLDTISNMAQAAGEVPGSSNSQSEADQSIELKVVFNKQTLTTTIGQNETVGDLKNILVISTGIPRNNQKLIWSKGGCSDDLTLAQIGAKSGSKFMMVGTTAQQVNAVQTKPDETSLRSLQETNIQKPEKLCEQTAHRKVIDKGIPSDVMPGILNLREDLPAHPLSGMLNKQGAKLRLTFKLEQDQVWIGTNERTQKVSIGSIRNVVSEPIVGHEMYHIMGLQMGPTEASRIWIYWVPAQYVDSIKEIFSQFELAAD